MKPDSDLLQLIKSYIEEMEPERKSYWQGGALLAKAFDEIERLQIEIADMEKDFLLSKTHD